MHEFLTLWVETLPRFLPALGKTLQITIWGLLLAMPIGLLICLARLSRHQFLQGIAAFFVWIIRSTPMIVQAFFLYFGIPSVIHQQINSTTAGIIIIMLNAGAYLSEIFRGGILAIPIGQTEAARSLGMTASHTLFKVVLPQAFRVVIPSVVNQFIISFKDTSILSVIGTDELVKMTRGIISYNYRTFEMWIIVALYYILSVSVLTFFAQRLERRLRYGTKS